MYHVIAPRTSHHIFTFDDPRKDVFDGAVQERVSLVYPEDVHDWPYGDARPDVCLGVSSADECRYQVFKTTEECRRAGFRPLGPNFGIFASWAKFMNLVTVA